MNGSFEKSTSFAAQMMQLDVGYEISVPMRGLLGDDSPSFVPLAVRGWAWLQGSDPDMVIEALRSKLKLNAAALQLPIGLSGDHKGVR